MHDVGRLAQLTAAGFPRTGQIFFPFMTVEHAAADAQEAEYDPFAITGSIPLWPNNGVPPSNVWAWLLGFTVVHDAAVDPEIRLTASVPQFPGLSTLCDHRIYNGQSSAGVTFNEVGSLAEIPPRASLDDIALPNLPFPIYQGGTVRLRSISLAAGTCQVNLRMWAGIVGTFPPGLA